LTRGLEGRLRHWWGVSGWGPGPGRLCSVVAVADAGQYRALAVPGAFAQDLESTVHFARSAAAIWKVLLPKGKKLQTPLQRSRSFTGELSSRLCTCSSRHAKPRVPEGKKKREKKERASSKGHQALFRRRESRQIQGFYLHCF